MCVFPTAKVTNLHLISMGPRHLTITWDVPETIKDQSPDFMVTYYPRNELNKQRSNLTKNHNFTLREFMMETEYAFKVNTDL